MFALDPGDQQCPGFDPEKRADSRYKKRSHRITETERAQVGVSPNVLMLGEAEESDLHYQRCAGEGFPTMETSVETEESLLDPL